MLTVRFQRPIQNRLTDLFSLFKFLRCSPFDDQKVFSAQVAQKWKTRSDPDSVAKLKMLVNCLALRRPKTTIELMPKRDEVVYLDFSREEHEDYQRVKAQTLYSLDNVGGEGGGTRFLNALKWVNELRLMCIHGMRTSKETQEIGDTPPAWSAQEAQARFDQLDEVGLAACSNAACRQDLSSALSSETATEHEDYPWIGVSLELWCSLCIKSRGKTDIKLLKICNHLPRRSQNQGGVDENHKAFLEIEPSARSSLVPPKKDERLPTKVRRLLQRLLETPEDTKRFVTAYAPALKVTNIPAAALSSPLGQKRLTSSSHSSLRTPFAASALMALFPPTAAPASSAFSGRILVSGSFSLQYPAAALGST